MTAARALQIDDWVVHRPNVVRSVMARVPGVDAEEATSRALEKMIRVVSGGGTITDPAPYWRRAAVNEAISMTRERGRATLVEDDTLEALTPPAAGAELDAERHADVAMLRTALAALADEDREILLERHVHDRAVSDIATGLGVRPHAVTMRLRRAEERLAGAFAAAHAQAVAEPECRATRAAMHDYLKDRLLPRRRGRVEAHMDSCADCTRAFLDVREVSWMLRDLGQHVVAAAVATGTLGAAVGAGAAGAAGGAAGAGAGAGAGASGGAGAGGRRLGTKEKVLLAVAAAVVGGGVAVGAVLLAGNDDQPPAAESVQGGGGAGGEDTGGEDTGGGAAAGSGSGESGADDTGADGAEAGDSGPGDRPENGGPGSGSIDGGPAGNGSEARGLGDGSGTADPGSHADGDSHAADTDADDADADHADGRTGGDAGNGAAAPGPDGSTDGSSGDEARNDTGRDGGSSVPDGAGSTTDPGSSEGFTGVGAAVRDVLASLGIGDGTPAEAGAGTERPATDDPAPDGPASADGTVPRVGENLMDWFGRLAGAGLPAFLVIVFLLWLWERWTRSENG